MSMLGWLWSHKARLARSPLALAAYRFAGRRLIADGKVLTLRRGPAAGCRWRHFARYPLWMTIGCYEPEVADLITQRLSPGDVFYDIGASAGYFTLLAARAVGPEGHVAAFDPLPANAETIRDQVRLNGFESRCRVEELAVERDTGEASFLVPGISACARLLAADRGTPGRTAGAVITVRTTSLDEYTQEYPAPSLVKMDIEGAEVQALEGASTLMEGKDRPHWIIAAHSRDLRREAEAILHSLEYRTSRLSASDDVIFTY